MTEAESHSRPVLRAVLAAVVVVDLVSFLFFLGDARTSALARGGIDAFSDVLSRRIVSWAVVSGGVLGAIAFARRPGRLSAGIVPLVALALLSAAHAELFGSPWRHLFYSGLCLTGWLLGLAVRRFDGAPRDESYARIGATALLGAAYLNAGISKMVFGGSAWISGLPVQAAIVAQDGLVADGVLSAYRSWAVMTPLVAYLFSLLTVGFELAGPLMVAGQSIRWFIALGLFAMHLNIYLLTTHILYWESMVLLLLFGFAPDEPRPTARAPVRPRALGLPSPGFIAAVAILALCALLAVRHQARRYARDHAPREAAPAQAPAIPGAPEALRQTPSVASASPPRQVGPFTVGQPLTEGWVVDALEIIDGGFVLAVTGAPGRARFEVTCAGSGRRSPFDLGAAHIFYSKDLEFSELESQGRALREQVRRATAGRDVCAELAAWRAAAQALP